VTNEPYFKDLLKFLDWAVYSEEGMTLTTWGVEGVTFENTSSGKAFLPQIKTPKNPDGTIITSAAYGFDMLFNLNENQEYEDYKKPAEIVKFLENSLSANETLELNPKLVLDSSSVEAIRLINEKIDPYVTETSVKFITGELNLESDWNAYLLELENRGYKTLEELWNDAWVKQNK
jgi:putative aldouronate transport system substrate-binding protein